MKKSIKKVQKIIKVISLTALVFIFSFSAELGIFAAENKNLTVSEALEMAIQNSVEIEDLAEDKRVSEENLDDAKSDIIWNSDDYNNLYVQIQNLENSIENYESNVQIQKDNLEYSIIKFFIAVIEAENDLKLYSKSLEISEKELKTAEIKYKRGLLSEADYLEQSANYKKEVLLQSNKKFAIEEAYIQLNKFIGAELTEKYNLITDAEYKPTEKYENSELENIADKYFSDKFSVKETLQSLSVIEWQQSRDNADETYSDFLSTESNKNKAYRNIDTTKTEMRTNVKILYNSIIKNENQYDDYIAELEVMKTELNVLNKKYELGKASSLEIEKKNYEIAELQNKIQSHVYSHYLLIIQFKNPELI